MERPNAPTPPSGIAGTIVSVIETVRDWRQLAIILVLAFFGLIGTVVYQARDRLIASVDTFMTTPPPVRLASNDVLQGLADQLYDQLSPNQGIVIWRVDLMHNRRIIAAMKLDPAIASALPHVKVGRVTPLLSRSAPDANLLTIRVIDGETPCGKPPREIWMQEAPIPDVPDLIDTVCLVGIPPTVDAFVGMIGVGFTKPPPPAREGVITTTLRTMAEQGSK